MRNTTRMGLALFGAMGMFVACSGDDTNNPAGTAGIPGASGGGAGGAGGSSAGLSGSTAGTGFVGGSVGTGGSVADTAGVGTGGTAGAATAGTAGTGGTTPVVVVAPTVIVLDNVRLSPASDNAGGAGGAGGAGSDVIDLPPVGGAGGAGGAGSEPTGPRPDFLETFDAGLGTFAIHPDGFSPSVGGTTGPVIFDKTTLTFDAAAGKSGGGAKISVPFSVKSQQADFARLFDAAVDLTGYEFTADVKLTTDGDIKGCISAWLYTWGGGYANDATAEPMDGVTLHLVKDKWTKIQLRMDGPYGVHSKTNFPTFVPTAVAHWGIQLNTFGCP